MRVRRVWAIPLVPLWWLGTAVKNALYNAGWLKVRRLTRPVISVGSLSAGGAGKTPVVLMLARLLADAGIELDVLSRGYGRGAGVVEEVDAGGDAARFGDEPVEMARAGVRVFLGAERFAAGVLAEANGGTGVHLLDDGFQHRRLGRGLDVVLLTLEDVEDMLLPAGNLREGSSALRRADVVVVREEEVAGLGGVVAGRDVWVIRRRLEVPVKRPARAFAFCGIARPEGFFSMVEEAGCGLVGRMAFGDHHGYTTGDFERLTEAARAAEANGFCTTAKDAVKISEEWRRRLEEVGPLWVAELRVELVDPAKAWKRLSQVARG